MDDVKIDFSEVIKSLEEHGLLQPLLSDRTTGESIRWVTNNYENLGEAYKSDSQITVDALLNPEFSLVPRAMKKDSSKKERTKSKAEVATPFKIVKQMNDELDNEWFGGTVFGSNEKIEFPEGKIWKDYIESSRLEITCGEAPFMVSRYDASTGDYIRVENRSGLLDRKLRVIRENCVDLDDLCLYSFRALQSTYGYELLGDSLLIARLNALLDVKESIFDYYGKEIPMGLMGSAIEIITWNFWQMDGLSGKTPISGKDCLIYDWRNGGYVRWDSLSNEE